MDFVPLHAPLAEQEVVLEELHVRVVWLPEVRWVGEAESESVGDGGVGVGVVPDVFTVNVPEIVFHESYRPVPE